MRVPTVDASAVTSLFHGPSDDKAAAAILPAGSGRGQEPGKLPLRLSPVLGAAGRGGPPRGSARQELGSTPHLDGMLPGGPRGPAGPQGKRNRPGLQQARHSHRRHWQDGR